MHVHVVVGRRHRVRDVHLLGAVGLAGRGARVLGAGQIERRRGARVERLLLVRLWRIGGEKGVTFCDPIHKYDTLSTFM